MKKHLSLLILCIAACTSPAGEEQRQQAEAEIRTAEAAFANMARTEGVPAAFLAYAAPDAVLLRGDRLIEGKAAIADYFAAQSLDSVSLSWSPDKVVAAASGDLGYTYGRYRLEAIDSSGRAIRSEGIFHTVWQRQGDGAWRFVWD